MFITFEGIEGCGKTTQIHRLAKRLSELKIPFVSTLEPGGTAIGKKIREMLLDSGNMNLAPLTELILYEADRAQHIRELVKPSLDQGLWVICDRFFDATVAYQGTARGLDMNLIRVLNERVTNGLLPDMTFLLDCPVEMGLNRARKRNSEENMEGQDRFEREKLAFHERVREGYLEIARNSKGRVIIIDASNEADDTEAEILRILRPFLETDQ